MLKVRHAQEKDIERICELYRGAQDFMARTGNPNQWGRTYPPRDMVEEDVKEELNFVIYDEDGIHGVFVLLLDADPCYKVIEDGEWKNDEPYVTIHRIASDFIVK
ncbi:MAG: N-acetyltransferase, partial [Clostridia bacterium]|nr:N-acetyltransferase [Clostridia bacterium]